MPEMVRLRVTLPPGGAVAEESSNVGCAGRIPIEDSTRAGMNSDLRRRSLFCIKPYHPFYPGLLERMTHPNASWSEAASLLESSI